MPDKPGEYDQQNISTYQQSLQHFVASKRAGFKHLLLANIRNLKLRIDESARGGHHIPEHGNPEH